MEKQGGDRILSSELTIKSGAQGVWGGWWGHDDPEWESSETERNSGHLEDRKKARIAREAEGGISSRKSVLPNTTRGLRGGHWANCLISIKRSF